MRLALVALLVSSVALAEPPSPALPSRTTGAGTQASDGLRGSPADAPVEPHTLLFPDGGRCENAAAARAEDKLLADARAEQVKPVLAAAGVGLVVGLVAGVVVGVLVQPLTKPKP